jgi:hypothetical protein
MRIALPMNGQPTTNQEERETTTRQIAKLLLYAFLLFAGALVLINLAFIILHSVKPEAEPDSENKKAWFELMKTNSVLLSTSVDDRHRLLFRSARIDSDSQRGASRGSESRRRAAESSRRHCKS